MFGHGFFGTFGRGFGYGYGPFGGYGFTGMFLLIAIGALVFFLFRRKGYNYNRQNCSSKGSSYQSFDGEKTDNALEVLKLRYAKGEITEEEYLNIKKTLME